MILRNPLCSGGFFEIQFLQTDFFESRFLNRCRRVEKYNSPKTEVCGFRAFFIRVRAEHSLPKPVFYVFRLRFVFLLHIFHRLIQQIVLSPVKQRLYRRLIKGNLYLNIVSAHKGSAAVNKYPAVFIKKQR